MQVFLVSNAQQQLQLNALIQQQKMAELLRQGTFIIYLKLCKDVNF
jgi:hypothetical protein